jgi:outer membrane protein assembly factor BamD (BamD/ComL family)
MIAMSQTAGIIRGTLILLATVAVIVWMLWFLLKKSEDPAGLGFRLFITAAIAASGYIAIDKMVKEWGTAGKIMAVLAGAALGLCMGIIWVPIIAGKVGDAFGSLFTGGSEPPPPQPVYSVAEMKLKQGKVQEAIYEIYRQLEMFPNDVIGQVMLAQIQAERMGDLPGAQVIIERFCNQPGHTAAHLSYALNALADWHLKAQDPEAARSALEKAIALLPSTEQAQMAAQRMAHLASPETLLAAHEHKPIPLRHGVQNIGLLDDTSKLGHQEEDQTKAAEQLVEHLRQYPLDNEAREKLAMIYFEHYKRIDLAIDELEQLINAPNQQGREVARWLNLIADLQVKCGADYDTVRLTLERVVAMFPGLAAEQLARQRMEYLRLEFRGKEKSQAVKLGSYEKDIGLKQQPPT